MTASSKSSASKKSSSSSKSQSRASSGAVTDRKPAKQAQPAAKTELQALREKEITGIILVALATLLLVNFFLAPEPERADAGTIGVVSLFFSNALRFCAGKGAFVLPCFMLIYGILVCVDKNRSSHSRLAGLLLMFCSALGFLHLGEELTELLDYLSAAAQGLGGGVIGAVLDFIFLKTIGKAGAIIVFIALLLIGLLLFFQTSLLGIFGGLRQRGSRVKEVLSAERPAGEENPSSSLWTRRERNKPQRAEAPLITDSRSSDSRSAGAGETAGDAPWSATPSQEAPQREAEAAQPEAAQKASLELPAFVAGEEKPQSKPRRKVKFFGLDLEDEPTPDTVSGTAAAATAGAADALASSVGLSWESGEPGCSQENFPQNSAENAAPPEPSGIVPPETPFVREYMPSISGLSPAGGKRGAAPAKADLATLSGAAAKGAANGRNLAAADPGSSQPGTKQEELSAAAQYAEEAKKPPLIFGLDEDDDITENTPDAIALETDGSGQPLMEQTEAQFEQKALSRMGTQPQSAENMAVNAADSAAPLEGAGKGIAPGSAPSMDAVANPATANPIPAATLAEYVLPPIDLIEAGIKIRNPRMNKVITDSIGVLESTLESFGVRATVTQVVAGPAVTRYELQPAPGVKVSRITSLADDIALTLAAQSVRIEAPIPGKSAIGIEVSRKEVDTVYFREMIESDNFQQSKKMLSFVLGKNIAGECVVADLGKMPHLLIAGTTGSGKSVCVNTLICSILYKARPDQVKLMLIDPKKVEMMQYANLPHLIAPVVNDSKKAANALKWVVEEMDSRYSLFVASMVKDFEGYNKVHPQEPMPHIVVIIDELADLMLVARHDVEDSICRIAQMARAAGIHLVVATQRPSVDVITGLIKSNIPSRIAFAVSSFTDSRTILDMGGAEKLVGRGDMLFAPVGVNKPMRIQGSFIDPADVNRLVAYCSAQASPSFSQAAVAAANTAEKPAAEREDGEDELLYDAGSLIISSGQASVSYLQRRLAIGNPRAARLMDMLESKGVVGCSKGSKPRDILMSMAEFEELFA